MFNLHSSEYHHISTGNHFNPQAKQTSKYTNTCRIAHQAYCSPSWLRPYHGNSDPSLAQRRSHGKDNNYPVSGRTQLQASIQPALWSGFSRIQVEWLSCNADVIADHKIYYQLSNLPVAVVLVSGTSILTTSFRFISSRCKVLRTQWSDNLDHLSSTYGPPGKGLSMLFRSLGATTFLNPRQLSSWSDYEVEKMPTSWQWRAWDGGYINQGLSYRGIDIIMWGSREENSGSPTWIPR